MTPRSFEESIALRQLSENVFESIHEPWTWPGSSVTPGGLLIALAASAASQTVNNYALSSIQTSFLSAPKISTPITFTVHHTTNGRRFTIRNITATQSQKPILTVTATFTNRAAMPPAHARNVIRHSQPRTTHATLPTITLDDLDIPPTPTPRWMSFQRLPIYSPGTPTPQTDIMLTACRIKGRIDKPPGHIAHLLGLLMLSDYHVLDAALTLNGITFGWWAIGDHTKTRTTRRLQFGTSLNHAVYVHDWGADAGDGVGLGAGWRADEVCYVEVTCPWAGGGRCVVNTRLFAGADQRLVASCVQESYYMLAEDVDVEVERARLDVERGSKL